MFESFGFKRGVPLDADFVFDVRTLPNPYYDRELRPLTGLDQPVIEYLSAQPMVHQMIDDIGTFIAKWLPQFRDDNRSYLTVAIGCTGGQHRSVFIAPGARRAPSADQANVIVRHRDAPIAVDGNAAHMPNLIAAPGGQNWRRAICLPIPFIADLPLFPLHTVLFPGGLLPLKIFEARYLDMARECLREKTPFGVCLLKSGHEVASPGDPSVPESVGCLAEITECDVDTFGLLLVQARGTERFRLLRIASSRAICSSAWRRLHRRGSAAAGRRGAREVRRVRGGAGAHHRDDQGARPAKPSIRRTVSLDDPSWVSNRLVRNPADSDARAAESSMELTMRRPASTSCITTCSTINCFRSASPAARRAASAPARGAEASRSRRAEPRRFRRPAPGRANRAIGETRLDIQLEVRERVREAAQSRCRCSAPPKRARRPRARLHRRLPASSRVRPRCPSADIFEQDRIAVLQHQHPGLLRRHRFFGRAAGSSRCRPVDVRHADPPRTDSARSPACRARKASRRGPSGLCVYGGDVVDDPPRATGRVESELHSDHEPGNSAASTPTAANPAMATAAVTPEPQ